MSAGNDRRRAFEAAVLRNEFVGEILERLSRGGPPDWYLSGGCLFQTVWNVEHGFLPTASIVDYDLFYFDGSDLSARAERAVGERVARAFAHLPIKLEVRNQARVHLWYEDEFDAPCRAFARCEDGIDGFLARCCCLGARRTSDRDVEIYAPHGFDDLFDLVVRPNPSRTLDSAALADVYDAKTRRWTRVWPRLGVEPWPRDA